MYAGQGSQGAVERAMNPTADAAECPGCGRALASNDNAQAPFVVLAVPSWVVAWLAWHCGCRASWCASIGMGLR